MHRHANGGAKHHHHGPHIGFGIVFFLGVDFAYLFFAHEDLGSKKFGRNYRANLMLRNLAVGQRPKSSEKVSKLMKLGPFASKTRPAKVPGL